MPICITEGAHFLPTCNLHSSNVRKFIYVKCSLMVALYLQLMEAPVHYELIVHRHMQ